MQGGLLRSAQGPGQTTHSPHAILAGGIAINCSVAQTDAAPDPAHHPTWISAATISADPQNTAGGFHHEATLCYHSSLCCIPTLVSLGEPSVFARYYLHPCSSPCCIVSRSLDGERCS